MILDGVAGNQTWKELGLRFEKEHTSVIRYGQPSGTSCWSAAASIILGNQSVGAGGSALVPEGIVTTPGNIETFGNSLGWRLLRASPSLMELVEMVNAKPLWVIGRGTDWAHAFVLSGVYSDGDGSGNGTMFRIHDPWPVGIGNIYGTFADGFTVLAADGKTRVPSTYSQILVPR